MRAIKTKCPKRGTVGGSKVVTGGSRNAQTHHYYDTALNLTQQGYHPLPVKAGTKAPNLPQWKEWQTRPVTVEDIERWWQEGRWKGVCVICGRLQGYIVIDIDDPEKFLPFLQQAFKCDYPDCETALLVLFNTPIVKTGGGGYHIYFAYPADLTVGIRKFPNEGFEVRGDGAIVVVPPTIHPETGLPYRWLRGYLETSLTELPQVFKDLIVRGETGVFKDLIVKGETRMMTATTLTRNEPVGDVVLLNEDVERIVDWLASRWTEGVRHDLALWASGVFAKSGFNVDCVQNIMGRVVNRTGDPEGGDRLRAVTDTYRKVRQGEPVAGWQGLERVLGQDAQDLVQLVNDAVARGRPMQRGVVLEEVRNPHLLECQDFVRDRYRFVTVGSAGGFWLEWCGTHWREVSERKVEATVMEYLVARYAEYLKDPYRGSVQQRKEWAAFCARIQFADNVVSKILKHLSGLPPVYVEPHELNTDAYLLNFQNGVLDLRTMQLRPHDKSLLITKVIPYDFDPTATNLLVDDYLQTLFPNPQIRRFVQRVLGVALAGVPDRKFFVVFYGASGRGKSTFAALLERLLGHGYVTFAPTALVMSTKNGQQEGAVAAKAIEGRRIVFLAETEATAKVKAKDIKTLTGGEKIAVRQLYYGYYTIPQTFTLFLITNYVPRFGDDHALWERVRVVPFQNPLVNPIPQHELLETLTQPDCAKALIRWLVDGWADYRSDLRWVPDEVMDITHSYRAEQDIIWCFINTCCIQSSAASVPSETLYEAFCDFVRRHGLKPISQTAFGAKLGVWGFEARREWVDGVKKTVRYGIALKDNWKDLLPEGDGTTPETLNGENPARRG